MHSYPFIFSDEPRYRVMRHLLLWSSWWFFQSILYSFVRYVFSTSLLSRWEVSALDAFFYMAPHIFLSYSLMYFVVPKLVLRGKYVLAALSVMVLFLLTGVMSGAMDVYWLSDFRAFILGRDFDHRLLYNPHNFFLGLMAGLRGAITIGGLAAAIKLMKHWYVKEQRNLQLKQENIAAQLQLLKAQVHPHFLFNTLNNIYAHAQVGAPAAPVMIAGLSDLLRYVLYECNQPLAPLSKELKMLQDYVLLEKVRYGNQLELDIDLPGDAGDLYIAPLLLLPFLENCFKHGASHFLDQPWISLHISIEEGWMKMKLLNAKLPDAAQLSATGGIGIANVRKRLELLYPDKHTLLINNEEEVFIVNLKMQLERRTVLLNGKQDKIHAYDKTHTMPDRG